MTNRQGETLPGEPVCRSCWLAELPEAQREQVLAEPVTMPVHLCPPHQAAVDELMVGARRALAETALQLEPWRRPGGFASLPRRRA